MKSELTAPTLTGSLLRVRPWRASDALALEPACGDPDICRFTTVPRDYSTEAARAWLERQQRRCLEGSAIVLAIEMTGREQPVGMVGLFGLDAHDASARFGYWVIRRYRGRGLATEAVRLLAAWAFGELPIESLYIDLQPGNEPSRRIAQALGASRSGPLTRRLEDVDVVLHRYALSRSVRDAASPASEPSPQ